MGQVFVGGPNYETRRDSLHVVDLHQFHQNAPELLIEETRGFASPAEIGLLLSSSTVDSLVYEPWNNADHQAVRAQDAWRIDYAGKDPFSWRGSGNTNIIGDGVGAPISTDVNSRTVRDGINNVIPVYEEDSLIGDRVSGDSEELNMLQAGISNMITTTSDVFTVHMRIRTFRKNSITNVWDATDLDYIIDDSRYVMLVDRSEVNSPQDKPKILYFEKLPN